MGDDPLVAAILTLALVRSREGESRRPKRKLTDCFQILETYGLIRRALEDKVAPIVVIQRESWCHGKLQTTSRVDL